MLKCHTCNKDVIPKMRAKGTQTEGRCPNCGTFLKWIGKTELKRYESLTRNEQPIRQKATYPSVEQSLLNISNQLHTIIELLKGTWGSGP